MAITLNGTSGITSPTYGGTVTAEYSVPVTAFKNRIINGAMMIDQRNAGASVTQSTSVIYTVDRWSCYGSVASKFTIQRNAGSITPPAGFTNYLGVTSSSAYTVGASEFFFIQQVIEGYNVADLGFGSASASSVTISFWVRSSLTGTFGGTLSNGATNRVYPFTYTISSANTWEQKIVTIAGDTSGTWTTDNTGGIVVNFNMGAGASVSGTAGVWSGSTLRAPTGATSVVGTNGATFYITGVQLEKGSTATSFDYRPYGTELALCQRYYEKSYNDGVTPGTSTLIGIIGGAGVQGAVSVQELDNGTTFKVSKRATPTMNYWDSVGNSGKCTRVQLGVSSTTNSSVADNAVGANGFFVYSVSGSSASVIWFHYTATAEL